MVTKIDVWGNSRYVHKFIYISLMYRKSAVCLKNENIKGD